VQVSVQRAEIDALMGFKTPDVTALNSRVP